MRFLLIVMLVIAGTTGCAKKEESVAGAPAAAMEKSGQTSARYMAYEHSVLMDVEAEAVVPLRNTLEAACIQASSQSCVVLSSQVKSNRDFSSAEIRVRAKPEGIRRLIELLGSKGKISGKSVSAEDLAGPIEDSQRKLTMLIDYRSKLEALRSRASNDVDALIKVNKELAQTQSDIEALSGEKAQLMQRVETEILNVSISSLEKISFWSPVRNALSDFGQNLSYGISTAITALAFIMPWLLVLGALALAIRKIWLLRKRKDSKRGPDGVQRNPG